MSSMKKVYQSIMDGEEAGTVILCQELMASGCSPMDILEKGMIPAMDQLGLMLARQEKFIPQVLMSTRAMQAGLQIIKPYLVHSSRFPIHDVIIIGTVQGDIHTIGKALVSIMLQSAGFTVVDLGTNVSPEEFAAAIREHKAQIVAMSAMLTTAMNSMREAVERLKGEDFGWPLHILVGGAPITVRFASEIGAEYVNNAVDTMNKALSLSGQKEYPSGITDGHTAKNEEH